MMPRLLCILALMSTIGCFIVVADVCPSPCWCVDNLTIVVCNLTGITEVPKGIPKNVITLLMSSNKISHISFSAFQGLNHLRKIDLSSNLLNINSFVNGSFNLPSIQYLDLSSNLFTDIPRNLPPKLSTLYFYNNPITALRSDSFVNATSIQHLNMIGSQVAKIEDHALDPLVNMISIDLSRNQLVDGSLQKTAFLKTTNLVDLTLNYNKFQTLPQLDYPKSLRSLSILGNDYVTIPSYSFKDLSDLTSLGVWGGKLSVLESNAFFCLSKVTSLDLEQSLITNISNLTFNGMDALTDLSIYINEVSFIDVDAFYGLRSVKHLMLSSNKLTTLAPGVLNTKYMPNLETVSIDGNPWICDCHVRWLREQMNNGTYTIPYQDQITCSGPPRLQGETWDKLKPSDFICK